MSEENITSVKNFVIVGFSVLHPNFYGLVSAAMFFVYICTLMGNGIFLMLFASERSLRKPMYYIIFNVSVCDVLYSTAILPKIIGRYWFNDGSISFTACFIQMFVVHYLSSLNAFLLGIMALDRYVAVCKPLRYTNIIKDSTALILCLTAWILAQPCMLTIVIRASLIPYCGPNKVTQCFCDHVSVTKLACTDRTPYGFPAFVIAMVLLNGPLAFILFSYGSIVMAVLRISSTHGKLKAFSTCSSQLIIIAIFFVPRCFNYMAPYVGISFSADMQILIIMLYSLLPPMINPLIYCLKTKEVKEILAKRVVRSAFFQLVKTKVQVSSIST